MKDEFSHHKALKLAADTQRAREHPRTNAERIRNMSDEELADFFYKCLGCELCPLNGVCEHENCKEEFLKWLRKEVE